jgi:hypothetical protein
MSVSCVEFGSRNLVRLATFLHFRHVTTVHSRCVLPPANRSTLGQMEGAVASWSIATVLLSQVPKFGIGPADNVRNANRLCRHLLITLD